MRMDDSVLQALTCDFGKNTMVLYMYRGKLRPVANSGRMAIHSVFSEPGSITFSKTGQETI